MQCRYARKSVEGRFDNPRRRIIRAWGREGVGVRV